MIQALIALWTCRNPPSGILLPPHVLLKICWDRWCPGRRCQRTSLLLAQLCCTMDRWGANSAAGMWLSGATDFCLPFPRAAGLLCTGACKGLSCTTLSTEPPTWMCMRDSGSEGNSFLNQSPAVSSLDIVEFYVKLSLIHI